MRLGRRLTDAEIGVAKAEQLVKRQRAMIEDLRRQRHDTAAAQGLLAQLELSAPLLGRGHRGWASILHVAKR